MVEENIMTEAEIEGNEFDEMLFDDEAFNAAMDKNEKRDRY